jgi:hypothetical protein
MNRVSFVMVMLLKYLVVIIWNPHLLLTLVFGVIHPIFEQLPSCHAINDYVCDKPACYNSPTGEIDSYAECCYVHYENDR